MKLYWIRYTPEIQDGISQIPVVLDRLKKSVILVYKKTIDYDISIKYEESKQGVWHYHILIYGKISEEGMRTKFKKEFKDYLQGHGSWLKTKTATTETIDYLHVYMLKGMPLDQVTDDIYWSNEWINTDWYEYLFPNTYISKWVSTTSKNENKSKNEKNSDNFHFFLTLTQENIENHTKKHFSRKINQTYLTDTELFFLHINHKNFWKFIYRIFMKHYIRREKTWVKFSVVNLTNCIYLHYMDIQGNIDEILDEMADIEYEKTYEKQQM